jgi:hypothetical protein
MPKLRKVKRIVGKAKPRKRKTLKVKRLIRRRKNNFIRFPEFFGV